MTSSLTLILPERAQAAMLEGEARSLLDRLDVPVGGDVIDIGCGPVGVLRLLAERVGPHGRVTGFDRQADMLDHAARVCAGLGNVRCALGDATDTGLPRGTFDLAHGWGGKHAWGPAFVLTHHIPAGWPRPNSTVHFVTDGIESAVHQAKAAAAGKSVGVHGADTIQQCLNAGLLDELQVDLAAVLLGSGVRLFDHLAGTPAVLGNPTVITGVGVTHLRYPVRKA